MDMSFKFRTTLFCFIMFSLLVVVSIPGVSIDKLGDAYANSVVEEHSHFYYNGENALGAPDGEYATIFISYTVGYLTLDMGEEESIIGGEGDDFSVIAQGNYTILVGNNISQPMTMLSFGINNQSFDLSTIAFNEVRYLRVEYGGESVSLDAIVAFNYNIPENTLPPTDETSGFSVGSFIIFSSLIYAAFALVRKKSKITM